MIIVFFAHFWMKIETIKYLNINRIRKIEILKKNLNKLEKKYLKWKSKYSKKT